MSARRGNSDEARAWRRGDLDGFHSMVENHQKKILNLVFRITGNYHEACDVTQESFIAAWRAGEPPVGMDFLPWLTGIALLKARERRTVQSRDNSKSSPVQTKGTAVDEWLQECLEMLPYELREVIVLRDLEQFSYEELCAILQIRQDLLRARLSRSREMLKNCLRDAEGAREGA